MGVGIRCKDCRMCKLGHPTWDHDCRKNYDNSAKSMEAHIAVELYVNNPALKKENVEVRTLIGDEDSSTIASVRRAASYPIDKWSDFNHVKKSFTSQLYAMKLPATLISYFGKSFTIAIKQNKGDASQIEKALRAVVPHAHGDHSQCGSWCEGTSNADYVHKNLPHGKPLTDENVKTKLIKLIDRYIASSEKIAQCASTQVNESMNQIISSKNPKSRHYAGSESLSFRVKAAVSQKKPWYSVCQSSSQKVELHTKCDKYVV